MIVETSKGRIHRTFLNANTGKVGNNLFEVYQGEPLSHQSVAWYFTVGYVPGDLTLFENIFCLPGGAKCEVGVGGYHVVDRFYYEDLVNKEKFKGATWSELLEKGYNTLISIVEKEYFKDPNFALGLTAGLDSRILLGALLEVTEASSIRTFSWGFRDTYDFEVGALLARKLGLKHTGYDLDVLPYRIENLERFAILSDGNINLFDCPPIEQIIQDYGSSALWYGVLGGTASGSNLPSSALEKPASHYLSMERRRTGRLADVAYCMTGRSISTQDVESLMSSYKQRDHDMVDIYNHHERLICHAFFYHGLRYSAPFGDDDWLSFALSLPRELRGHHRKFLVESIRSFFPNLASFPSGNYKGMSLFFTKKDRIFAKIQKVIGQKTNKRKKFVGLKDLSGRAEWRNLLDRHLFRQDGQALNLHAHAKRLMNEVNRIDHWKTLELIFSLSVILEAFSKKIEK